MPEGFFLVVEGPEGSGKSTQLRHLATRLQAHGLAPLVTREPGGTAAGDGIRAVLLDPALEITPVSEFLLYCASRAQHVLEVIHPGLAAGRVVLCDRFYGASLAYQGYGRGLELRFIRELTRRVTGGLEPDLTLLFDIDPAVGLKRVAARGARDRLERADMAFHRRVREGFLAQAGAANWHTFDAHMSEASLQEQVWRVVQEQLAARGML